ncbi:Wzz/FepE/Etk N-terminal domain-containing protein [Albibacterium bauzanense]|uniref:Subunit length determinant protein n=1 Tax=Albibacterium bauzanense TaxID=653929 RepID=A0A4R1M205_9SPHI|nr:Wzz/FepE/Etk N-terminal domain-containing protein [Albibacterium bauzanense]TCK84874.1 subunit length determinant protein [Albibacterium bauzanense]
MERISFKELTEQILRGKYLFIACMVVSLLIGFFVYMIKPKEYASSIEFLISNNEEQSNASRLGSLASLAGISSNSSAGIPVSAYEFILSSTNFLSDVVAEKIVFEGDTIFISNYLTQRMVLGFKNQLKTLSDDDNLKVVYKNVIDSNNASKISRLSPGTLPVLILSGEISQAVGILRGSIVFSNEAPKPILLTVKLQDPEASAKVAKVVLQKLEEYINLYSKENKIDNTDFLEQEVEKSKQELYQLQNALAAAQDRNINANKAIANLEIERLNLRYSQARSTYSGLLAQLDNSKIQVENQRPLFIIIEAPIQLNELSPSEPRLVNYIILSIILGVFVSLTLIFAKSFFERNL